ncbi:TPA: ead/Ea22-like family protein [Raoultella planticola]
MTTDITELAPAMKAAAEKATPGEWWSDVVETGGTHGSGEDCMEGFHSYAVYDQNNHSLLDMTNSTAACITVEDDGDYIMAWDEVGRANAEFIALANPANILALVEALEKAQAKNALVAGGIEASTKLHGRIAELEQQNSIANEKVTELSRLVQHNISRAEDAERRAERISKSSSLSHPEEVPDGQR